MSGGGSECAPSRRAVHAPICKTAADELRAFCADHGVTVTAYIDAHSHALAGLQNMTIEELTAAAPTVALSLLLARKIDAERRARA